MTARQVTLYLGDVKPGSAQAFAYTLRPKHPVRAKASAVVAYEYYTPAPLGQEDQEGRLLSGAARVSGRRFRGAGRC